jgi:hypothetical protein
VRGTPPRHRTLRRCSSSGRPSARPIAFVLGTPNKARRLKGLNVVPTFRSSRLRPTQRVLLPLPPGAELAFEFPGFSVWLKDFAEPME